MANLTKAGGARPGAGRPRGTINKRTRALSDKLVETGSCPAEALVRIARQAEIDNNLSLAVDAWKAVLPYVHAKPKAVEFYPESFVDLAKVITNARIQSKETNSDLAERMERAYARLEAYSN